MTKEKYNNSNDYTEEETVSNNEDVTVDNEAGVPVNNREEAPAENNDNSLDTEEQAAPEFDHRDSGIDSATWEKVHNYTGRVFGVTEANKNTREGPIVARQIKSIQRQLDGSKIYNSKSYLMSGIIQKEISISKKYSNRKTGFPTLDAVMRLNPGVYAIGADTGSGKTTLMLQMADNLAERGVLVFYFSLEQTAYELMTKSLSRTSNEIAKNKGQIITPRSAAEIRDGAMSDLELETTINEHFFKVKDNLYIIECNFSMSAEAIENTVYDFMVKNPDAPSPVVIVDYLQILAPSYQEDGKLISDTRAKVDAAIHSFKAFQVKYQVTMFVVCSFNRERYQKPVDFEAFKESGGIEYTADVVIGLQYAIITEPDYYSKYVTDSKNVMKVVKTSEVDKQNMMYEAKNKDIRDMQLVILKNRNGRVCDRIDLSYEPKFDTFYDAMLIRIGGDDGDDGADDEEETC